MHSNARLTEAQRKIVQDELRARTSTQEQLASRFGVHRSTIRRWAKREGTTDLPSGPKSPRTVITPAYRRAVIDHRFNNEDHGPITIAYHLKENFPFANRGTVLKILQQERIYQSRDKEKPSKKGSP